MHLSLNRVLLIDPSGELRDFLRFCAARFWPKLETLSHLWARGCPDATFDWTGIELVLLEHRLHDPNASGMSWLRTLKRNPAAPPVIFITAGLTEDLRLKAERAGAAAALNKDDLSPRRFAACVERVLSAPEPEADEAADADADAEEPGSEPVPPVTATPPSPVVLATAKPIASHAPEMPPPIPGFTLMRPLSVTHRGWVCLAMDESRQREVALKIIRVPGDVDVSVLRRFSQEYTSLKFLKSPHVVRVHERGFAQHCAFISMEYCTGGDLRQRIAAGVSQSEAIGYLTQMMLALKDVHARGILHRDIKPGSLLLREDGTLALSDFGSERELSDNPRLTATSALVADLNYVCPESIRYGTIDVRGDLYSAGAVLYHLLTGSPPFGNTSLAAMLEAHLRLAAPRLPPRFAAWQPLLDGLLAKDPDERFQTAEDVLDGVDWLCRASA
jgi:DNA-binding NarL/FixJ family response regulator